MMSKCIILLLAIFFALAYTNCDRTGLYEIASTPNLSNLLNTILSTNGSGTETRDTKMIYAAVEEGGNKVLVITDGDTVFNAYTTNIANPVEDIHVTESGYIFIVDSNKDIFKPSTPGDYSTWIDTGYDTHTSSAPVVGMTSQNDILYVSDGNSASFKIYKYDTAWADVASHGTYGRNNYFMNYSEIDNNIYILSSDAGFSPYVLQLSSGTVTDALGNMAFGGADLVNAVPTYVNKIGSNFYIGDNDDILSGFTGGSFAGAARVTYDFDVGFPPDPVNDVCEAYLVTSDNHIFVSIKNSNTWNFKLYYSDNRGTFADVSTISNGGNPDMIHTKLLSGGNGTIFIGVTEDIGDTAVLGLYVYDYVNGTYT